AARQARVFATRDRLVAARGMRDDTLRLWDLATGREIRTLRGTFRDVDFALAPDGQSLACVVTQRVRTGLLVRVQLYPLTGGDEPAPVDLATLDTLVHRFTFSADGRMLAATDLGLSVHVWDVTARMERTVLRFPQQQ